MAKQRRPAGPSARGREARGTRRPASAGPGPALVLLLVAAVGVGGYILFRHTAAPPRMAVSQPSAPQPASVNPARASGLPAPTGTTVPPAASPAPAAIPAEHLPQPPFGESEDVFETAAKVYVAHCASCHGRPGAPAAKPAGAAQLWDAHNSAATEPPGALYLQIADGVPAAHGAPAMSGYRHVLADTEIWDLALLLRNAHTELPDPVLHLLRGGAGR